MYFLIKHPLIYSPNFHPKLRRWNAVIREFGIRETRYANDISSSNLPKQLREFRIRELRFANYRVAVGLLVGQSWE